MPIRLFWIMADTHSLVTFESKRPAPPEELFLVPHWFAVYTRAHHEKQVDERFRRQGIESWLPLVPRQSQWKDRRKAVHWPMFPSYLFGCFTLHRLVQVLSTHGVATVVSVRGTPVPIPQGEIESLRVASAAVGKTFEEPERAPMLEKGTWVRVVDGPFAGVRGIVVERPGDRRVRVGIAAIGQAIELNVGIAALVPDPPLS